MADLHNLELFLLCQFTKLSPNILWSLGSSFPNQLWRVGQSNPAAMMARLSLQSLLQRHGRTALRSSDVAAGRQVAATLDRIK